jgi:hypothetical protein
MRKSYFFVLLLAVALFSCGKEKPKPAEKTSGAKVEENYNVVLDECFYKHFDGKIGSIPLKMEMIKQGTKLWGSYYFDEFGVTNTFEGTTDNQGNFTLKELTSGILPAVFAGKFIKQDSVMGYWINSDNSKTLKFNLKEDYSKSLALGIYPMKDSLKLGSGSSAYIDLTYFYPVAPGDSLTKKWKDLAMRILQKDTLSEDINEKLKFAKSDFFAGFKTYVAQMDSLLPGFNEISFSRQATSEVLINDRNIFSLETTAYEYSGGAHGQSNTYYLVFDLLDQRPVYLSDILTDNYSKVLGKKITDIVLTQFQNMEEGGKGKKLMDFGFFTDTIMPNANFYLTKNGLGFVYNEYEVGPYSLGKIKVFFPFREISTIIRTNSCMARLIAKNE